MAKFWLIQRGKFNTLKEYGNLTGEEGEGLIDLDYMGYAEFEWNAIPCAFRRIMQNREDYIFHYCNDIKDHKGKIMVIFCNKNHAATIEAEMKRYIEKGYPLKSFSSIRDCIEGDSRTDAFWCIDKSEIGDWIAWFGMNKVTPVKRTIDRCYTEWWLPKPEYERERTY